MQSKVSGFVVIKVDKSDLKVMLLPRVICALRRPRHIWQRSPWGFQCLWTPLPRTSCLDSATVTSSGTSSHTVTHSDTQWHTVTHSDTQWHNWCISSAGLNYTPLQWFSFRPNRWHITSAEFAYAKFMCIVLLALQPTRSSHLLCCTLVAVQLACVSNACFLSTEIPFCLSIFLIYIYVCVYNLYNIHK